MLCGDSCLHILLIFVIGSLVDLPSFYLVGCL